MLATVWACKLPSLSPREGLTVPRSLCKHVAEDSGYPSPSSVTDETRSALAPSPEGTRPAEESREHLWPFTAGPVLTPYSTYRVENSASLSLKFCLLISFSTYRNSTG